MNATPGRAAPRVLMIGWEFPPRYAGGLGVACQGLVRGLLALGAELVLLLPRRPGGVPAAGLAAAAGRLRLIPMRTKLEPYGRGTGLYGDDLWDEVSRLAAVARVVAREERCDVIHVHDWMTYPAGLAASDASGRPLLAHVHATEFSRSGGGPGNAAIEDLERQALRRAARVLCVSRFTASVVRRRYNVAAERIRVVHNAIDGASAVPARRPPSGRPVVLFAGRLTRQKGPSRFLEAARLVRQSRPETVFVMAGDGDRRPWLEERAEELGLADVVAFPGFLPAAALRSLYAQASVYVLPSVAEPFGLTVLEALGQGAPTIVSRQAGVGEVVRSVIRVDASDPEALAARILWLIDSPAVRRQLSSLGRAEVARMSWEQPAARCLEVYRELA
ncbi:MAG TPA: glycosyltransferase family 4 protein [Thermoanaerobaculia bacterium]|nr:glycosyltransferase family 4 protein [Thermoanaerobaculia bacterium]